LIHFYKRSDQSIVRDELSQQVSLSPEEGEPRIQVRLEASLKIQVEIKEQVTVPFQAVKSREVSQKI